MTSYPNITSREEHTVYLVTGATGAIGKAIARQLAMTPQSEVVLVCRDGDKGKKAVEDIIAKTQNPNVRFELADLSRRADIENLASNWQGPLHVLINNAACTPRTRQETMDGIESQFATNVLGYFNMIRGFTDVLKHSAPARIVNVASYWAGGLDLNDLEFTTRRYNNDLAYRQSKQADRMLSAAFSQRLEPFGIAVNACHPGDVNSTLSNNLGFGGHESPDQGAETPVWLATDPVGRQSHGKYYEHRREVICNFSRDKQAVNGLYQACMDYANRSISG